jgi:GT2 family glycosyltransferase
MLPVQEIPELEGNIDGISLDGEVVGWCWKPRSPHERLSIEILIDGSPAGAAIAGNLRQDLLEGGIGDGRHAFRYFLPASQITGRRSVTISIRDALSGHVIGKPHTVSFASGQSLDGKVEKLENGVQAAQATLRDVARSLDQASRAEPMRELLLTLGSFLQHAASNPSDDRTSPLLGTLRGIIAEARERYSRLTFSVLDNPSATIIVIGRDRFDATYATLQSLKVTGVDSTAEVLLVDCGSSDCTVFSPLLLANVRYIRAPEASTDTDAINLGVSVARSPTIVLLTNEVRMESGWLGELLDTFEAEPECVAVCPSVQHHDGVLASVGADIRSDGQLVLIGSLDDPRRPEYNYLRSVDSVTWSACAISREYLVAAGGLDPLVEHGPTALADLCLRATLAGHRVMCQPLSRVRLQASAVKSSNDVFSVRAMEEEGRRLLLGRWAELLRTERRASAKPALVIAESYPASNRTLVPDPLLEQMLVLRELGYDVACAAATETLQDEVLRQGLQRVGIRVLYPPTVKSPTDALVRYGAETALVLFDGNIVASRYEAQVESMAPSACKMFLRSRGADESASQEQTEQSVGPMDIVVKASVEVFPRDTDESPRSVAFGYLGEEPTAIAAFDERIGICILDDYQDSKVQEAIDRFLVEVMPELYEEDPTIQLFVPTTGPIVRKRRASNLDRIHLVRDMKTLVERVRLQVVPPGYLPTHSDRVLAGILHGLPLVADTSVVRSLGLQTPDGVAPADTGSMVAKTIAQLHADAGAWTTLSERGRSRVGNLFGRMGAREKMRSALRALEQAADQ